MSEAEPKRRRGTFVQEVRARLVGGLAWMAGHLPKDR